MDDAQIHDLIERRDCDMKSWFKESLETNSEKLLAQLTNVIHDRDKQIFEAIAEVQKHITG